jgi:hypothetical protein
MTHEEFINLKVLDLIDVDFSFSNIHIKGKGVVTRKYPSDNNWMDLEAVVIEADGGTRNGPLDRESCTIIPPKPTPVSIPASNSDDCIMQLVGVLKQYAKI